MKYSFLILGVISSSYVWSEESNLYVGTSINNINYEEPSSNYDVNLLNIGLLAGKKINDNVALEARVGSAVSGENITPSIEIELDYYISTYIKGLLVIDHFDVYGLLGYTKSKVSSSNGFYDYAESASYGIGSSYNFNEEFSIGMEYLNLVDDDKNGYDLSTFNIGINYKI